MPLAPVGPLRRYSPAAVLPDGPFSRIGCRTLKARSASWILQRTTMCLLCGHAFRPTIPLRLTCSCAIHPDAAGQPRTGQNERHKRAEAGPTGGAFFIQPDDVNVVEVRHHEYPSGSCYPRCRDERPYPRLERSTLHLHIHSARCTTDSASRRTRRSRTDRPIKAPVDRSSYTGPRHVGGTARRKDSPLHLAACD